MTDVVSGERAISVTLKYKDTKGKGFDMPWAVFKGNPAEVFADICLYFGFDNEVVAGLSLHELVHNAEQVVHGTQTAGAILGAVAIPAATSEAQVAAGGTAFDEPAAPAESAGSGDGVTPLYADILKAESVDELKRLWAENQAAFADADLMAAWKARGKALSA